MHIFGLVVLAVMVFGGVYLTWFSQDSSTVLGTDVVSEVKEVVGDVSQSGDKIEIYDGYSFSENITDINLSGKDLSGSLKAEVRHLKELKVLDISGNNFSGLPAEIGQLSKLEILNLSNNPLTGLPYELGNLQKLQTLDLRGTTYVKADLETIKAKLPSTTKVLVD